MAEHRKHGDFIMEITTNKSMFKEIVHDQVVTIGKRDMNDTKFSFGISYITEPFLMVDREHTHTFDQILYFLGDQTDFGNFGGVVELNVGNEHQKYVIDYTACVYIPAGVLHCPLDIIKVNKPFMFIDITLSEGISAHPLPEKNRK